MVVLIYFLYRSSCVSTSLPRHTLSKYLFFPIRQIWKCYVDIHSQISNASKHLYISLLAMVNYPVNCLLCSFDLFSFSFFKYCLIVIDFISWILSFYMLQIFSVFSWLVNFIYDIFCWENNLILIWPIFIIYILWIAF